MTEEGRKQSSAEELQRADEELRAAEHLLSVGMPRIAMTRVYFAAFHGLRGRLYAEGLEPRSHRGVQHLFNLHFVRTGRYPTNVARLTARLQKFREEADYAEAFVIDDEGAREELAAARQLVEQIQRELAGDLGDDR